MDYNNFKERIKTKRQSILKLESLGDRIYYGDDKGRIYELNTGELILDLSVTESDSRFSIFKIQDSIFYAKTNTGDLIQFNMATNKHKSKAPLFSSDKKYLPVKVCGQNVKDIFVMDNYTYNTSHLIFYRTREQLGSVCVALESIGRNSLLAHYNRDKILLHVKDQFLFMKEVDSISGDLIILDSLKASPTLLEHMSHGYFMVSDKKHNYIFHKDTVQIISNMNDRITSCKTYNDTSYLLSDKYIFRIALGATKKYCNLVDTMLTLTDRFNYRSTTINDFEVRKDTLFLATDEGLMKLKLLQKVGKSSTPKLIFHSINSTHLDQSQEVIIDYSNNDISINLDAILISENPNIKYEYQLLGVEDKIQTTIEGQIRYPDLAPGSYTFNAQALDEFDNKSELMSLKFEVEKP